MKIVVDRDKCQGHTLCAVAAPNVFVLDEDGYNNMTEFEVAVELEAEARCGAEACPERAILLTE